MSQNPNPFQPPTGASEPPLNYNAPPKLMLDTPHSTRTQMEWMESVSYVFRHPDWMMTLLFGAICQMIPIVGPLVAMGYQFETMIDLTTSQGSAHRAFDFNRFMPYLKRGAWPFLVAIVVGLVLAVPLYIFMIVGVFAIMGIANAAGEDGAAVVGVSLGILGFVALLGVILALNMIIQPMILRAALTQQFGEAFKFGFVSDFVRKVGKEMFVAFLFQMAMGMLLTLVGMIACFVGIYPAVVVVMLMQAHIQFQLYELYRARGGEVIPLTSAD